MSTVPAVIVRKGGALSALASGFFSLCIVAVLCATGLGVYGMHLASRKVDQLLAGGSGFLQVLPQWRRALPPALSDALLDRRDPGYREQVRVDVRLVPGDESQPDCAVVEVANTGSRTVSLMGLRLVLEDSRGVPVREQTTWAATPVAADGDWRGPLLPGQTRRFAVTIRECPDRSKPAVEITELRVWDEQASERLARAVEATTGEREAQQTTSTTAP